MFTEVKQTFAQLPWQDSAYKVIWVDEFSSVTTTNNNWIRRFPWGTNADSNRVRMPNNTWTDHGVRIYAPADTNYLKLNNGTAKILAKNDTVVGECWSWPTCGPGICNAGFGVCDIPTNTCWHIDSLTFKYESTMLFSNYRFKYGYFEIKFKLPALPTTPSTFNGLGPNFWLYGRDPSLNNYWSEIDIFEIHGYNNELTTNVVYNNHDTISTAQNNPYVMSPNISGNTWHTAGVHWKPDGIDFYYDRQYVRSQTNVNIKPDSLVEMHIIVDINTPTWGWNEPFDATTVFPYTYEVDYVKVWQLKENCDTAKSYCSSFNPSTYNSKLYRSVSIGGTSCVDTVTNIANLSIYGKDYVLLNEGFRIDNNSAVLIKSIPCTGTTFFQRISSGSNIFPPPKLWKYRNK